MNHSSVFMRKHFRIVCSLLTSIVFILLAPASSIGEPLHRLSSFKTLESAIPALGDSTILLLVDTKATIENDTVIPSNITLRFSPEGRILGNRVLTIQGELQAEPTVIFGDCLVVRRGKKTGTIHADWFDGNDTHKLQAAVDMAQYGGDKHLVGVVQLQAREYVIHDTIRIQAKGVGIVGAGKLATRVTMTSEKDVFLFKPTDPLTQQIIGCFVRDLTISSNLKEANSGAAIVFDRVAMSNITRCFIKNTYVGIELLGNGESCMVFASDILQGTNDVILGAGASGIIIGRREVSAENPNRVPDARDKKFYTEPNSVYLSDLNIRSTGAGIDQCLLVNAVDGLYMSNCHLKAGRIASFRIQPTQANLPLGNVLVSNVLVDPLPTMTKYGLFYDVKDAPEGAVMGRHAYNNVTVGGAAETGIYIAGYQTNQPDAVQFVGGIVKNSGGHAVEIETGRNISFANFEFRRNDRSKRKKAMISLKGGESIQISNCMFAASRNNAVEVLDGVKMVSIINNHFSAINPADRDICLQGKLGAIEVDGNRSSHDNTLRTAKNIDLPVGLDFFSVSGGGVIDSITSEPCSSSYEGRSVTLFFEEAARLSGKGNIAVPGGLEAGKEEVMVLQFLKGTWRIISRSGRYPK
jgi:hypothetical protein